MGWADYVSVRLAKKDRGAEAIDILARIQAGGNVDDPLVVAEWEEITTTLAAERAAPPGWRKFFYNGMWKRTLAGFTCQMWQQSESLGAFCFAVALSGRLLTFCFQTVVPTS